MDNRIGTPPSFVPLTNDYGVKKWSGKNLFQSFGR